MTATIRRHALTAPLVTAAAVAGAWAAVAVLGPERVLPVPCPLLALTGIACPFCGGARAAHALAHGDIALAAGYNLVAVAAVPLVAAWWLRWLVRRARGDRVPLAAPSTRVLAVAAVALLAFGVVRNLPAGTWLAP